MYSIINLFPFIGTLLLFIFLEINIYICFCIVGPREFLFLNSLRAWIIFFLAPYQEDPAIHKQQYVSSFTYSYKDCQIQ